MGVSLTGICDHPVMSGKKGEKLLIEWLTAMRKQAREGEQANGPERLGINPSRRNNLHKTRGHQLALEMAQPAASTHATRAMY